MFLFNFVLTDTFETKLRQEKLQHILVISAWLGLVGFTPSSLQGLLMQQD